MTTTKKIDLATVWSQRELTTDIYDLWIQSDIAKDAKPGQFLCIYPKNPSTLLPRPISICEIDAAASKLRIVYRVVGSGTREFSSYSQGETIRILGPLGNGFPNPQGNPHTHDSESRFISISESHEYAIPQMSLNANPNPRILLVGGGIGIPPLLEVAKRYANTQAVLGYRDANLFLMDEFAAYTQTYAATQDGSAHTKGTVIDAIQENNLQTELIFACGPMPMLRAIKEYAASKQIQAYLSLEERMACGIGACLGCVARTKQCDPHTHVHNARICTEGPVFAAEGVDI
ncbi:MAG: dihydroorotate dehydrogenase electron transfer subunit [Clostridium sp.]|nr:dihydroorotate dehydrogenase electron transfer subunit [Clostridium sp.]